MANVKTTGSDTHKATQRGYAVDPVSKAGVLVEEGELVPAGIPVSENWMEPVKGGKALAGALEEAADPKPKDVDMTKLNVAALRAMAAERGINVDGLSKADLIKAIAAKVEKDAG